MESLQSLQEYAPLIIPLAVIQVGLMVASLVHVLTHKTYRVGNRPLWVVLSFVSFIGPILYFALGKGDE